MTDCVINPETLVCRKCGRSISAAHVRRTCKQSQRRGLGDMVKAGLSAFGITEDRVSKAIGKPCGCSERAKKLNALGHKYLGLPPGEAAASS